MTVEEQLHQIIRRLGEMKGFQDEMRSRLKRLESESTEQQLLKEGPKSSRRTTENESSEHIQSTGNEKSICLTFGDEGISSPEALQLFLDHYEITKEQNMARKIDGWESARFRANEIRLQLRGEPAVWLSQECGKADASWTKDDEQIIARLRTKYMSETPSVEENIIAFEELSQDPSEALVDYLARCQDFGFEAFGDMDSDSTQQRIVWKFLSGINDNLVRAEVIKEKWMESSKLAKNFDDVLLIAEKAFEKKAATSIVKEEWESTKIYNKKEEMDGKPDHIKTKNVSKNNEIQADLLDAALSNSRAKHTRAKQTKEEVRVDRHGSSESSNGALSISSFDSNSDTGKYKCHFCNTADHYGGWKFCPQRLQESPNWTPGPSETVSSSKKKKNEGSE